MKNKFTITALEVKTHMTMLQPGSTQVWVHVVEVSVNDDHQVRIGTACGEVYELGASCAVVVGCA